MTRTRRAGNGTRIFSRVTLALLAAVAAILVSGPAPQRLMAMALAETEEERIGRALQAALEKHGGDVNRCFEKALADTLDVAGTVELEVDVGEEGRVTHVEPGEPAESGSATSPVLLACLQDAAATWTLAGVGAGSTVILPLSFQGQMAQFSVKAADAPERGPGANKAGKGKGKPPRGAAAFTVKVLVDEATMRARQASLSLLTIAPANRIATHKHPGAEILYVKKGRARVLGPVGTTPEVVPEGSAVLIPPNFPHVLENMVRTAPVEIIQIFAPLGPERVYRDPTDATGRAAFEVIRDARKAKAPAGAKLVGRNADKVAPLPTAGGKARTRILFDAESTGVPSASLSLVELDAGAEIARHEHGESAEILYILSGRGELTIGSDKIPLGPEQAVHLPQNQPHSARLTEKTVVLQVYAPAGPEQRFKQGRGRPGAQEAGGPRR